MAVNDGWELLLYVLPIDWQDLIVLIGAAAIVAKTRRRILAISAVLLFTVSFPPFSWPTWWFCLVPLVWLWRDQNVNLSRLRLTLEAVVIGFAMAWVSTGFVRDAVPVGGGVLHGAACLVFSLQFVGLALAVRLMRDWPVASAAALSAAVAVAGELLQAVCGVAWSVTSFSLAAADTPVAQWAATVTPFGVSGILYLVNFLFVRNQSPSFWLRWTGPISGVGIATAAWFGGCLLASATRVEPLPFSVMLVQPHVRVSVNIPWRPWRELDPLTRSSLQQAGCVDLIVWPEACLSESQYDDQTAAGNDVATRLTVQDFAQTLQPLYQTSCLVGVSMWKRETTHRYGLEVAEGRRYNCGCLVSGPDKITCHEKRALVPFKEGLPGWLNQEWIRGRILPALQLHAPFTPGSQFRLLSFLDRHQQQRTIAVCVCYESFLPWLPQYRKTAPVDAIVHLVYDGDSIDHPELLQRQILACRYRAIETRTWNLVCSTWSGSAIIDPAGRVICQLPATAGVLRSDDLGSSKVARLSGGSLP